MTAAMPSAGQSFEKLKALVEETGREWRSSPIVIARVVGRKIRGGHQVQFSDAPLSSPRVHATPNTAGNSTLINSENDTTRHRPLPSSIC
jgi:hypothetical protein